MKYLSSDRVHARWNKDLEPLLTIAEGETVLIETRDTSDNQIHPSFTMEDVGKVDTDRIHPLTGPLYIEGAEPGDTLEIVIGKITTADTGFNIVPPGGKHFGFLPEKSYEASIRFMEIDNNNEMVKFADAIQIPLNPFLGVMGVAPRDTGEMRTLTPGAHGGNLDLKELTAGAKLYLPVFVRGALFSAGDCHAAQGDGEVTGAAVECAGKAELTFNLIKGTNEHFPRAETATHFITLGFEEDLTAAARKATERMIDFIAKEEKVTESEAYSLCSVAADVSITQVVNGIMGAHVMMPKAIFLR
jgi:acetamidase/formamidase